MKRGLQGKYVTISTVGEKARAFVPAPLPPYPPIDWSPELQSKFDQALLVLGRLDSVSVLLPDTSLFLYMYVRKEAVFSSMLEGTQSSLSDLLLFELNQEPGVPLDDVREVSNYVAALDHGLRLLADGLPLSLQLIREIHGVLLSKGRGSNQTPGSFVAAKIGSAAPGRAMRPSFRLRPRRYWHAWASWSSSSMTIRCRPRCFSRRPWPMCNLRRSIHSWMAMAGWGVC